MKMYKNPSFFIVMVYLTISALWIFGSDWVLMRFIPAIELYDTYFISVLKGMVFVFLTAFFFYMLINNNFKSIQEGEERYRKLVEHSPEAILVHVMGEIVYVNEAGVKLAGATHAKEIVGKQIFDFVPFEQRPLIQARMQKVNKKGTISIDESEIMLLNGEKVPIESTAFKTTFEGKEAIQVIIRDISKQKKTEEKVRYYAYYDFVTGLPNRHYLMEYTQKIRARAIKENKGFSFLLLDLDRFKVINDTLGHRLGDQLLKNVSERLKECIEEQHFIARFGGDEYVILVETLDEEEVEMMANKIIERLSTPFQLDQNEVYITPSIGLSMFPKDGYDIDSLLKKASVAIYAVKQRGRNDFAFFDAQLFEEYHRKMSLEQDLRKAIDHDALFLQYQPQVHLLTGEIIGLEALVRWNHPTLGLISPSEFIQIAEETGQIGSIGEWILRTACMQLKEWERKGIEHVHVSVNVSVYQFLNPRFVHIVEDILKETEVNPSYVQLEITESFVHNLERSIKIINQLKSLGIKIAIDDFGKGYSSLSVLKSLPVDHLKIDKSFIQDVHRDGKELLKTIIQMGRGMKFTMIAEGVEEETHVFFLKESLCHIGQGYYFSKPLNHSEIEALLTGQKTFLMRE